MNAAWEITHFKLSYGFACARARAHTHTLGNNTLQVVLWFCARAHTHTHTHTHTVCLPHLCEGLGSISSTIKHTHTSDSRMDYVPLTSFS